MQSVQWNGLRLAPVKRRERALLAWTSSDLVSALAAACICVAGCAGPNATAVGGSGSIFYPQGSAPVQDTSVQPDTTIAATQNAKIPPKKTQPAASGSECGRPEDCLAQLKMMTQGPDRRWIRQPQSAVALTSGVRLFAYAALRKQLTCDELALALAETKRVREIFQGTVPGVGPERVASVTALNARVGEQLRVENAGRCTHPSTAG
jgi:hypothetical protein